MQKPSDTSFNYYEADYGIVEHVVVDVMVRRGMSSRSSSSDLEELMIAASGNGRTTWP